MRCWRSRSRRLRSRRRARQCISSGPSARLAKNSRDCRWGSDRRNDRLEARVNLSQDNLGERELVSRKKATRRQTAILFALLSTAEALTKLGRRLVGDDCMSLRRRVEGAAGRASGEVQQTGRALVEILRLPLIDREKDVVQCPEKPGAAPVRLESDRRERQELRWIVGTAACLGSGHMRRFGVQRAMQLRQI